MNTEIRTRNLIAVKKIGLKIGVLSGLLPDALAFGFEALVKDTPLEKTLLEIEHVPVSGTCEDCGKNEVIDELKFSCPACGSTRIKMTAGDELRIAYLEVEEPDGSSQ